MGLDLTYSFLLFVLALALLAGLSVSLLQQERVRRHNLKAADEILASFQKKWLNEDKPGVGAVNGVAVVHVGKIVIAAPAATAAVETAPTVKQPSAREAATAFLEEIGQITLTTYGHSKSVRERVRRAYEQVQELVSYERKVYAGRILEAPIVGRSQEPGAEAYAEPDPSYQVADAG